MRKFAVGVIVAGLSSPALAGSPFDLPILRGALFDSPAPSYQTRWEGTYAGVQFGRNSNNFDFSSSSQDLAKFLLQASALGNNTDVTNWAIFGKASQGSNAIGGFVGYNMQWDQAVIGIEANYNVTNATGVAPIFPISRGVTPDPADGYYYDVTMSGSASARLRDYGTARVRAAYATGNFLPYLAAGVAVGRADFMRSVTISGTYVPVDASQPAQPFSFSQSEAKTNAFIYGYSFGAGLDMLLFGNVFGRVEWERIQFAAPVEISIDTVRGGLGVKF